MRYTILPFLIFIMLANLACFETSDCRRGNFRPQILADELELYDSLYDSNWMEDAKECTIGDFIIFAPAEGDSSELWVTRRLGGSSDNERPGIHMDAETLTVFGSDHRFRAQFTIPDAGGTFNSLQYKGFDAERNADVTAFDFDFDGRLDARRIYSRDDGTSTAQHRIGSEWHDLVEREGHYGYILEGRFYPIGEGKEQILKRQLKLNDANDG